MATNPSSFVSTVVSFTECLPEHVTRNENEMLVAQSCPFSGIPWTVACQAPLSMGFSREEYWSGLSFPPPGDLPDPRIKPMSLAAPALADRFFTTESPGKPINPL